MGADPFSDARIVAAWGRNARPWVAAVRDGRIGSRVRITDRAIVDAVTAVSPRTVLDVGCGEGWLARALSARGIDVFGVDVVPDLVEAARRSGGGDFRVMSLEEIAAGKLEVEVEVDVIACNFSLLGRESVEGLFRAAPSLLGPRGALVVQTLHPAFAGGKQPYRDGWRGGSWEGIGDGFADPAPWYFRTMDTWAALFAENGLRLREMREPVDPQSRRPASVIFIGAVDGREVPE